MRPHWSAWLPRIFLAAMLAGLSLLPAPAAEAASRQARIAAEARRIAAAWKATNCPPRATIRHPARAQARARVQLRHATRHRRSSARMQAWRARPKPWALAWKAPARQADQVHPPPLYLGDLYVAASQTPLLQSPSTAAARLANLPRRTVVTNMGRVGNFHKVEAPNGAVGYVARPSLSITPPRW